jgi:hypothetical protein
MSNFAKRKKSKSYKAGTHMKKIHKKTWGEAYAFDPSRDSRK